MSTEIPQRAISLKAGKNITWQYPFIDKYQTAFPKGSIKTHRQ
jgi:hypothetical protein